jgi:fido (protein-threonine AMPylation protein)
VYSAQEKEEIWNIAAGLQAVDGLEPSDFARGLAADYIGSQIRSEEIEPAIRKYYSGLKAERPELEKGLSQQEEADIVSRRIVEELEDPSFSLSLAGLKNMNKKLFSGLFTSFEGSSIPLGLGFRTYYIEKSESVLGGSSVVYGSWETIQEDLEQVFSTELQVNYVGLGVAEQAELLATFTQRLWQVHPFSEGNTRTIAVFIIKYARSLGFAINNEPFDKHSRYFRDALVRASAQLPAKGIARDTQYLNKFVEEVLSTNINITFDRDMYPRFL